MITRGIKGLLSSRKGTLSIIILMVTAALAVAGKLDATFAAVIATIQLIYCWTQAKTDQAAIANNVQGPNE